MLYLIIGLFVGFFIGKLHELRHFHIRRYEYLYSLIPMIKKDPELEAKILDLLPFAMVNQNEVLIHDDKQKQLIQMRFGTDQQGNKLYLISIEKIPLLPDSRREIHQLFALMKAKGRTDGEAIDTILDKIRSDKSMRF